MLEPAQFGRVAVLMGGFSAEREVSLWSGGNIVTALRGRGVDVTAIDVTGPQQLFALAGQGYDRVFNILHGTGGEDGRVQAVLDLIGLRYPGSGVLASALAMDKLATKRLWQAAQLPTPDFRVVSSTADVEEVAQRWGYPFILKPAADGSSVGISKVKRREQIAEAFAAARGAGRVVLAEQFIAGGEYTCAVLGAEALPLIRIEPDGEFYDYHAKYISDKTRYHCPAGLAPGHERSLQDICRRAFEVLGCADWGRVDFLMGEDGKPWLLEVNTLPGMTSHSLVPMAAQVAGIGFDELCLRLLARTLTPRGAA